MEKTTKSPAKKVAPEKVMPAKKTAPAKKRISTANSKAPAKATKANSKTPVKKTPRTSVRLQNATLITGASSGIGLQFAHHYAKTEKHLVLVARRKANLERLKKELLAKNLSKKLKISVVVCDLSQTNAVEKIMAALKKAKLQVNILINNAGLGDFSPFTKSQVAKNHSMLQVNVATLTQLTHALLPTMIALGYGRIVQVASVAGFMPGPLMAVYFATKAYVLSFSLAIREEVKGSGVHITALCPGTVPTEFNKVAGARFSSNSPGALSAKTVAETGARAVEKNDPFVIPGILNKLLIFFLTRLVPKKITASLTAREIANMKQK